MKKYTNAELVRIDGTYSLKLTTNEGYANEIYDYEVYEEAMEAFNRANFMVKNRNCKQDFEGIEKMSKGQYVFTSVGLNILKQGHSFMKWALN